ncbi:MAG: 3-oxoacyl-ACP reductase FabG [Vampirovibrio sp.]|nr:3-oxoacyl-ACP reductase FabG [Vampirovibrio sp.]
MGILKDKKVFVTGGSRGLGRALCEVFAREGADVAFNYNSNDEGAQETIKAIEAHGRKGLSFKISVTDKEGIDGMVKEVMKSFGQIDILVNNAAINKANSFVTTTEKAWREIVETNVNGLYYVTKPFFRHMVKQRFGNILNISSIGAIRALPTSVHYATAKSACIGFTKCLAREAGQFGVTVNAIAAGILNTDLGHSLPDRFQEMYKTWTIKGRLGAPEELAEFAAFLASDKNTFMTGEIVTIDGGCVV